MCVSLPVCVDRKKRKQTQERTERKEKPDTSKRRKYQRLNDEWGPVDVNFGNYGAIP